MKEVSDWSMFDISSISHRIDIAELDENNVKNERIVWENVAKLSIDLFLDYDYYKQFTFQVNESWIRNEIIIEHVLRMISGDMIMMRNWES